MDADNIITALIIILLIIFSAFFSASECAFSSLNRTRLRAIAEKGNKRAARACELHENYDKLISTILVGNNMVNIAMASLGTVLFVRICGDIGATVSTAVITVMVLIFGEITPKSVAKDCPERFAMFATPLLRILVTVLTPINYIFTQWKKLVAKVVHVENDSKMSQDELLMLVSEVQNDGSIDKDEGSLIRNAIEFTDIRAEDILTHRVDIAAVSVDCGKDEIAEKFSATKFSRLLVYEDTIDHIVGVIHQKDLYNGAVLTSKPIEKIMTPPLFVLKSEKVDELMRLLQSSKSHVAVVLDEYGGTLGIVTLEDILEELVGEIWDEHDEVVQQFEKLPDGRYRVSCSVTLDDFKSFFNFESESDSISIGGFVMEQLGKIPEVGDGFHVADLDIEVTETDGQRVEYIEVTQNSGISDKTETRE